jgi:hypothetical protein
MNAVISGRTDVVEYLLTNALYKVPHSMKLLWARKIVNANRPAPTYSSVCRCGLVSLQMSTVSLALGVAFGKGDELAKVRLMIKFGMILSSACNCHPTSTLTRARTCASFDWVICRQVVTPSCSL